MDVALLALSLAGVGLVLVFWVWGSTLRGRSRLLDLIEVNQRVLSSVTTRVNVVENELGKLNPLTARVELLEYKFSEPVEVWVEDHVRELLLEVGQDQLQVWIDASVLRLVGNAALSKSYAEMYEIVHGKLQLALKQGRGGTSYGDHLT